MNAVPGVLKTTLGPDDAPEGLTRLRKAVIRIVTVCCKKRCGLNPAKGKSAWDDVQEHPGASFHITSPSRETQKHFILLAKRCQPGKLTWSLVSRGFPAGQIHSHTVSGWPASACQTPAPQKQEIDILKDSHTLSDETGTMWPKASGMQKDSGQVEYSKGSERIYQEPGKGRSWRQTFLGNVQSLSSQTCFVSTFRHKYLMIIKQIVKEL